MEFRSCARGRQWLKPRLLFSRAGYASWGAFPIHQFVTWGNINYRGWKCYCFSNSMHVVALFMCKCLYRQSLRWQHKQHVLKETVQMLNYCWCWTLNTFYFKTKLCKRIIAVYLLSKKKRSYFCEFKNLGYLIKTAFFRNSIMYGLTIILRNVFKCSYLYIL